MDAANRPRATDPKLSNRERELLVLAAAGFVDKAAAERMGVSVDTVRTYWKRIRTKCGDHTRSALVANYVEGLAGMRATAEAFESIFDWEIDCEQWTFRSLSRRLPPAGNSAGERVPIEEILCKFHPEDREGVRRLLEYVDNSDIEHFYYVARTIMPPPMHLGHAFALVLRGPDGKALRILGRRVPLYDLRGGNDPFGQALGFK